MKKRILGLVLALCMALSLTPACAQEGTYVPGEITKSLFKSAFDAGKIINADVALSISTDTAAFFGEDEEGAKQFDAVMSMINDVKLSLGVGKIADGVRVELTGSLVPEGTAGAGISAAADLTREGVSVESDLIEGRKLTATWETILQLAGVDQTTSALLLSLRDIDLETAIAAVTEQAKAMAEMAKQAVVPYAETAKAFVATLPSTTEENVPADSTHPAVAKRVCVTFTPDDLRMLLTQLTDQLEQDESLVPLLDLALAQGGADGANTAALCASIREELADLTGTEPFTLTVGQYEDGSPAYVEVLDSSKNGMYALMTPPADGSYGGAFSLAFIAQDGEGEEQEEASLSMSIDLVTDNEDLRLAKAFDIDMGLQFEEDGESVVISYDISTRLTEGKDGLPAYLTDGSMNMIVLEDGDTFSETMTMHSEQAPTATGGESSKAQTTAEIVYPNTPSASVTADGSMSIEPTEDGFTGRYIISEQLPTLGIRDCTFDIALGTREYDAAASAALTPLALESATSEDISALVTQANTALQQKTYLLLSILPPDVLQALSETAE